MSDLFINSEPAAIISADSQYRYLLKREWGQSGKKIVFIGLNPSTADATNDDPTIRRCVRFAKAWGGTSLWMINLFAFRSTDPRGLLSATDPIGPENDVWLDRIIRMSDLTVAAWGNNGKLRNRGLIVEQRFAGSLHMLGMTDKGEPRHPLYIRADTTPILLLR